jgi:hypothetical protein
MTCKGYHEWYKALDKFKHSFDAKGFSPEGTIEEVYPPEVIGFKGFQNVRAHIWPWMMERIKQRDKCCQDCGTQEGQFEVHHIISRFHGGTDHPANLKMVCNKCHRKYTNDLMVDVGKARQIKNQVHKVKQLGLHRLDDF